MYKYIYIYIYIYICSISVLNLKAAPARRPEAARGRPGRAARSCPGACRSPLWVDRGVPCQCFSILFQIGLEFIADGGLLFKQTKQTMLCCDAGDAGGAGSAADISSHLGVSTLFVTTASTETLNGKILGVTCFRGRNSNYTQNRTSTV